MASSIELGHQPISRCVIDERPAIGGAAPNNFANKNRVRTHVQARVHNTLKERSYTFKYWPTIFWCCVSHSIKLIVPLTSKHVGDMALVGREHVDGKASPRVDMRVGAGCTIDDDEYRRGLTANAADCRSRESVRLAVIGRRDHGNTADELAHDGTKHVAVKPRMPVTSVADGRSRRSGALSRLAPNAHLRLLLPIYVHRLLIHRVFPIHFSPSDMVVAVDDAVSSSLGLGRGGTGK